MHIAKQTVHIEVEITIGFHFEVFRMVNLVPQTARYRSPFKFSLVRPHWTVVKEGQFFG